MFSAKQSLEKLNALIEGEQESSFRSHLGASVIGEPCLRELWFGWRWIVEKRHKAQLLRLFRRGHLEEPLFMSYLKKLGAEVWDSNPNDIDPKTGKARQWRVSFHDGHAGGSCDAVARGGLPELEPNIPYVVSCKTHNDASFKKLLDMGVMGSKFEHFVQEQIYMHFMGLKLCLYMAVNKNDDNLHFEFLNYDPQVANNAIKRAGDVIYANEPPKRIATTPGAYACKFCAYNRLCHFGDVQAAVNCRTCRFSRPGSAGSWICGLRNIQLDEAAQRAGCGSYQVHPKMNGPQSQ